MGMCGSTESAATGKGKAASKSGSFDPPPGQQQQRQQQQQRGITTGNASPPAAAAPAPSKAPPQDKALDADKAGVSDSSLGSTRSRHNVTPSIREKLINIHAHAKHGTKVPDTIAEDEDDEENEKQNKKGGFEQGSKTIREGAQRLRNIFAAPLEMAADFVAPVHAKTKDQYHFIDAALSDNFIFDSLDKSERKTFIDAMEFHSVPPNVEIIRQGDIGDYFYVIQGGTVRFTVDGEFVGSAKAGGSFGELALLYNCPRAATCISQTPCELWRVEQKTFRKILASHTIQDDNHVRDIVRRIPFLEDLDAQFINKITDALTPVTFVNGEVLVRKGDMGNVFYIIEEGTCKVTDIEVGESKYADVELGPGDHFGERAIVTQEPRVANVTATSDGKALCMTREDFEKIFGNLSDLIIRSNDKRKLMSVPIFAKSNLEPHEIDTLTAIMDDVSRKEGFIFAEEDMPFDPAVYFIRSGRVSVTSKNGTSRVLSQGGYFGDDTLRSADQSGVTRSKYTIKAVEDCTVAVLTIGAIESVISDISRLSDSRKQSVLESKLDKSVKLGDLQKHRILGAGTFGQVWLVSRKGADTAYALKIQNKKELCAHHQVEGVVREKNIMASIDHPFIIKLVNTYQDDYSLFMLLNLVQGGELFSVMHTDTEDGVPESSAKFYASGIFEGLSYMHRRHILYRDLKPENVLIDSEGYTVIVDLGFAKIVMDKTFTLCGTPLYLAPEVILSRGHDKGADHWSLGVLIYEMILGITPFYDHNIDQITLFKRIVNGRFLFPSGNVMSPDAKDLIKHLLVTRPTQRLGSLAGGEKDIFAHPWFADIDFEKLRKKKIPAPWVPKIKNPLDVSNFDNWDHLEHEEKNKVRPTAKENAMFKDF